MEKLVEIEKNIDFFSYLNVWFGVELIVVSLLATLGVVMLLACMQPQRVTNHQGLKGLAMVFVAVGMFSLSSFMTVPSQEQAAGQKLVALIDKLNNTDDAKTAVSYREVFKAKSHLARLIDDLKNQSKTGEVLLGKDEFSTNRQVALLDAVKSE